MKKLLAVSVVAVVALGFGAWWFLVRDDAPPEADIDQAAETLADEAADDTTPDDDSVAGGGLTGSWTVATDVGSFADDTATFVGYRVQEDLAGIGANTAVGRTPEVTGTVTLDATTVTEATIEADLTALESDNGSRDGQLRGRGLETDAFPTATFVLTEPLDLGAVPAGGETVAVDATGELTLHGVTREVTLPLELVLEGDLAAVTGSLEITLADYRIEAPVGFRVVSIEDTGTFELQLFLRRS